MANSGSINSGTGYGGLSMTCNWEVRDINNEAGTANLYWDLFVNGSASTSYAVWNENYLNVNDSRKWTIGPGGSPSSSSNPYNMYTPSWNHQSNPEYVTKYYYQMPLPCWIWRRGRLSSGSVQITYNDDGVPQNLRLQGAFCWYSGSNWVSFDTGYFKPNNIERFNKSRRSGNQGSSWSRDKYFWKTTDYGRTWKKCKGYKTTNKGSSWSKV